MFSTKVDLDAESVAKLRAALKEAGPTALADLRREMKSAIKPVANRVKGAVPTSSPFKGMNQNYYGRVQWIQPKVTVSFTPGRRQRFDYVPLLSLVATGGGNNLGFDYAENAGVRKRKPAARSKSYHRRIDRNARTHAVTTQGDELIAKARKESRYNFKAGHFAYGEFLSQRPTMIKIANKILDGTAKRLSLKLERS
jgi:hypothetical protein